MAGDGCDSRLTSPRIRTRTATCPIKDDKTGETLPLEFVEMHQPVRHLKKDGEYFACTDFRKPGSTENTTTSIFG